MSKKREIIKDTFKLTFARYISLGIGVFTAIALRKFMGPLNMGVWSLLMIVSGYVSYLYLGVDTNAAYKIPFHEGADNKEDEDDVRNISFTYIFLVSILIGITFLAVAFLFRKKYPTVLFVGLCTLSVYTILNSVNTFYQMLLRAKRNFSVFSKVVVFNAIINLVLICLLVSNFKIYGMFVTLIVVTSANLFYAHAQARYRVRFKMVRSKLFKMMKFGFPVFILGLLAWTQVSLDRMMIGKMLGVTFVGYYTIPIMIMNYMGQLTGYSTVLGPYLIEKYGRNHKENSGNNKEDGMESFVTIPTFIMAYTAPLILAMVFFLVPVIVRNILPEFVQGILPAQILLVGIFFSIASGGASHFLIMKEKQRKLIPFSVAGILLNFVGNYIFIRIGYGIAGVAVATSIVLFIGFAVVQIYAMKYLVSYKSIFSFLMKIICPIVYSAGLIVFIQYFVNTRNSFFEAICRILIFSVLYTPFIVYVNKKTKVLNLAFSTIVDRISGKSKERTESSNGIVDHEEEGIDLGHV